MGKKVAEMMKAQKERFIQGAKKKGVSQSQGREDLRPDRPVRRLRLQQVAQRRLRHLAYQTAYLKAHYSRQFMAALLTSERGSDGPVVKYINECKAMGIKVLPPDVNASDYPFTVDGGRIRFGLSAVKNVGEAAVARARRPAAGETGPFALAVRPVVHDTDSNGSSTGRSWRA